MRQVASLEDSLRQFAEAHPIRTGPPCWVCTIPERAAIEAQRKAGVPYSTIARWLKADPPAGRGYPVDKATENKLQHHFKTHVK